MQRTGSMACLMYIPPGKRQVMTVNTADMFIQNMQPGLVEELSYVTVLANKTGRLILKVLDVEGRIAKTVVAQVNEGRQQLELNMADLHSGRYVLNAFSGDIFLKSLRFEKQ